MNLPPESLRIDSITATLAKEKVAARFPSAIAQLGELVRIPGIAWDSFDATNLESSATAVAELLKATKVFDLVEIRRASYGDGKTGAPAVVAHRPAKNGRPQILLYAHHDVQPPGDQNEWKTPEFEPTLLDGRIYGRGAADDKAGIMAHLTAINSLVDLAGPDFELGISVFVEGEEEAGSPSFRNFLIENQDVLNADVIVVADSANWTTTIPALTTTLRGLVAQEFELATLDHAVHSGMYGGPIPDAMTAMIKLLATLHDDRGNVAVRGLVQSKAADLDYDEVNLRTDSGLLDGVQLIGEGSILDRMWTKPAIAVIGIDGMSVATSSNTLLPSVKAKVSMRIAPGQEPMDALAALRAHLTENAPFGAKVTFGEHEAGKPFQADDSGWAKQLAGAALSAAFGNEAVDIGIGGSIPFIADLLETFPNAQILVTGVEDADSRAHSPNESVHLETLRGAMVAETLFLLKGNDLRVN